ncbi:hypothetical protein Tco_1254679 [Tanacetum coccineum]
MSDSEHSTVTYTSLSEDDLYMGSPGVEVHIYEGPPSPDYIMALNGTQSPFYGAWHRGASAGTPSPNYIPICSRELSTGVLTGVSGIPSCWDSTGENALPFVLDTVIPEMWLPLVRGCVYYSLVLDMRSGRVRQWDAGYLDDLLEPIRKIAPSIPEGSNQRVIWRGLSSAVDEEDVDIYSQLDVARYERALL